MNTEFARRVLRLLDEHAIPQGSAIPEQVCDLLGRQAQRGALVRLMDLLWVRVSEDRWVDYDYEFYEGGIPLSELVEQYAQATAGEWVLENLQQSSILRDSSHYILLDFTYKGKSFHWEFDWSGGYALQACELTIHQFAHTSLTGDFVDAGGMFDQCTYLCYLPQSVIMELRALMQQVQTVWPTADELILLFEQKQKERLLWNTQWGTLIQHSDLLHVNDMTAHGHRPLHTAVQQVLQGNLNHYVLPVLVGDYGANPALLDGTGLSAFDYAQGEERVCTLLQTAFTGKMPVEEEYRDQDWYLPIGLFIPS